MKNFFRRRAVQLALCCLLSAGVTLAAVFWQFCSITGDGIGALRFLQAMHIVKRSFNGEINDAKLYDGAIKGMVDSLGDPYTVYLDSKDFARLNEMTEGSFGGIGIVFGKKGQDYIVISALPDNPGALAGIKSGDIITAVDGKEAKDMNMEQVAAAIRGQQGTEVELELKDKEGALRRVRVVRKEIKTISVGGEMLEGTKIGYIRIAVFNENTGDDFAKKYRELESEGMQALVLDLRANPGGLLDAGVAVAGMLVPKGPIVSVVDRGGSKFTENSPLEQVKYPLAVLVDHGTASAAEIVAGAVKDTGSGRLFGVQTFGKGSVQSVYRLGSDTAIKVTTAKYYTPSGVSIHNVGIAPDEIVELPENVKEDTQLAAARRYLQDRLAQ